MTMENKPVSDAYLHAYVDGQLNDAQRAEVDAYLKAHPLKARQVEQYRQISARLHARFDATLREPLPETVLALGRQADATNATPVRAHPAWWRRAVAVMAMLIVGGASGWLLHAGLQSTSTPSALALLTQRAVDAHRVYSREGKHVVEVGAGDKVQLMTWLSGRLGHNIGPADLTSAGYTFLGGRLLPADGQVAGVYMYEDAQRQRLTEYITVESGADSMATLQCQLHTSVGVCRWSDGPLSFVLVGVVGIDALHALANQVREQAARTTP